MSKKAIMTIVKGQVYEDYATLTHPTIRAYAEKCGAEFLVSDGEGCAHPAWAKLEFPRKLFEAGYDKVLHIDTDMLVKPDTPNLFDLYPSQQFVCFDENKLQKNDAHAIWYGNYAKEHYGYNYVPTITFNTGLFLMDKSIKNDLILPQVQPQHPHYEQPYLTMLYHKKGWDYSDHPFTFNYINNDTDMQKSALILKDQFIPHFSADFNHRVHKVNMQRMQLVLNHWSKDANV